MRKSSVSQSQSGRKESEKRKLPPHIRLSAFADPRQPWILVPDGSLQGYFDWVPKELRVGPWSKLAIPTLVIVTSGILYYRPTEDSFDTLISSYPPAFSNYWWYNVLACLFMLGTLMWSISLSSPAIVIAFTILSWIMNILRHGINACAPFLCDNHVLLKVNHIIRFPALVTATITFVIWNVVLLPYVYFIAMKTREKKLGFARWNFNFRLTQLHFCNIIYSVMNTLVTGSKQEGQNSLFDREDMWYGFAFSLVYGLWYTLILDRIGIHLYPVFSPRSKLVMVTWLMAFSLHYISFEFWNHVITDYLELFRFDFMIAINCAVMLFGAFMHWILSKKEENDRMRKLE
jgi:hypothetical protein